MQNDNIIPGRDRPKILLKLSVRARASALIVLRVTRPEISRFSEPKCRHYVVNLLILLLHNCKMIGRVPYQLCSDPFTIFETQNPMIHELHMAQKRRSPDFEALQS